MHPPTGDIAESDVVTGQRRHLERGLLPVPVHHGLAVVFDKLTKAVEQVFMGQTVELPVAAQYGAFELGFHKLVNEHMAKHVVFRVQ